MAYSRSNSNSSVKGTKEEGGEFTKLKNGLLNTQVIQGQPIGQMSNEVKYSVFLFSLKNESLLRIIGRGPFRYNLLFAIKEFLRNL